MKHIILRYKDHGYNIHAKADELLNSSEPVIVDMEFEGTTNPWRRYSYSCITHAPDDIAVEAFISMLKRHDWYYAYSDDYRVWRTGDAEAKRIQEAIKSLVSRDIQALEIYRKYAPKH